MRQLVGPDGDQSMRKLIFATSIVVVGVVAVLWLNAGRKPAMSSNMADDSSSNSGSVPASVAGSLSSSPVSPPLREGTVRVRSSRPPAPEEVPYLCDDKVPGNCGSALLGAQSRAEARWLIDNGYPTPDQVRDVDIQASNLVELQDKADKGSIAHKGLLGRAYINAGRTQEAFNVLSEAIAGGSVYAVYEMSRLYSSKDFRSSDVHESAAYVRAAYLLGDSRASEYFYLAYPNFGTREFALADRRGQQIYQGLLKVRVGKGINKVTMRPRA